MTWDEWIHWLSIASDEELVNAYSSAAVVDFCKASLIKIEQTRRNLAND